MGPLRQSQTAAPAKVVSRSGLPLTLKRLRSSLDSCSRVRAGHNSARAKLVARSASEDHRSHVLCSDSRQRKRNARPGKLATLRVTPAWGHICLTACAANWPSMKGEMTETAMLTESLVYKLGHVTSYEYQRGVLGPVHTIVSPVPDFPALVQARAASETCLESHHKALTAKIKHRKKNAAAKQVRG